MLCGAQWKLEASERATAAAQAADDGGLELPGWWQCCSREVKRLGTHSGQRAPRCGDGLSGGLGRGVSGIGNGEMLEEDQFLVCSGLGMSTPGSPRHVSPRDPDRVRLIRSCTPG